LVVLATCWQLLQERGCKKNRFTFVSPWQKYVKTEWQGGNKMMKTKNGNLEICCKELKRIVSPFFSIGFKRASKAQKPFHFRFTLEKQKGVTSL